MTWEMRVGAEELTLEIWVKLNSYAGRDHADEGPNNPGWILGHDNGGYDRAICLHDQRYGGIAAITSARSRRNATCQAM